MNEWLNDVFQEAIIKSRTAPPGNALPDFPKWNEVMRGFPPHQYTVLCGPTGIGKTTFLANMSKQLLLSQVQHLAMPIETGRHNYSFRVASAFWGEDILRVEPIPEQTLTRFATSEHFQFFTRTKGLMRISPIEMRTTVEDLMRIIRKEHAETGCQVVFIDNLNFLLEVKRAQDSIVEMDRVTHTLIEFVKSLPIHIVMVMHPRKTEEARVVSEYDIKGSSTAVQEAHSVLLLNYPNQDLVEHFGAHPWEDREITFAKLRHNGRFTKKRLLLANRDTVLYFEKGRYDRYTKIERAEPGWANASGSQAYVRRRAPYGG